MLGLRYEMTLLLLSITDFNYKSKLIIRSRAEVRDAPKRGAKLLLRQLLFNERKSPILSLGYGSFILRDQWYF